MCEEDFLYRAEIADDQYHSGRLWETGINGGKKVKVNVTL